MKIFSKKNIFVFCLLVFFMFSGVVSAGSTLKENFSEGLNETGQGTGHVDETNSETGIFAEKTLVEAIGYWVGVLLSLVGVFFLLLMIYGGYIWMMARGNEQEATKAKNIIVNAIIGVVIVLGAYAITNFIMNSVLRYIYEP